MDDEVLPQPPKLQKKEIKYGPAPADLVEAIRAHLRKLIEEPDLDSKLGEISRVATHADDLLMICKSPEAVMRDEHAVTLPGVTTGPSNAETYGATMLRQIIPVLSKYIDKTQESPQQLTYAIAAARQAGMTDLAAELEKKLVGKPLDGERPIGGPFKSTAAAYLTDEGLKRVPTSDEIRASAVEHLETSVRLAHYLRDRGCKTVGDAEKLLTDHWPHGTKRIGRELQKLIKELLP